MPPACDLEPSGAATGSAISARRSGRDWYVVETLPRREAFAIQNLALQQFPTFWPRFKTSRTHARKTTTVLAGLFPNYVFVQINPEEGRWRSVNGTFGVRRLVASAGGKLVPMMAPAMDQIFARCHHGVVTPLIDEFEVGQMVKVISGPLAEQLSTIERLDGNGRVRVLMDLLGTKVSANMPIECLAPQ